MSSIKIDEIISNNEGQSINTLMRWLDKEELITGIDFQRNFVWSEWKQSNLILSALLNIPIPTIYIYRPIKNDKIKKVFDGKQRLTTFQRYIKDCFALDTSKFPIDEFTINGEDFSKEDLNGVKFSELSPDLQEKLLDRNIKIEIETGADDNYSEIVFSLMNMGAEALKPQEIRLATMGKKTRKVFNDLKQLAVFKHGAISDKQKNNNIEHDITAQTAILLHFKEACELSADNVSGFINQYRDLGLPEELHNDIKNVFEYLSDVTEILVKEKETNLSNKKGKKVKEISITKITALNKTNIVMFAYMAKKALNKGITVENFTKFISEFSKNVPAKYRDASSSKTASIENVRSRMEAIENSFNQYIGITAQPKISKITIPEPEEGFIESYIPDKAITQAYTESIAI